MNENEQTNQCGKLKRIQDFYPRDIESCHLAAARRLKLWSLNTNLFLKELHQLNEFTKQVHVNNIWQRKFQFKDLIAIFLGLQTLWPYSLTTPNFSYVGCSFGLVLSKTKSVTPIFFFYISARILSKLIILEW